MTLGQMVSRRRSRSVFGGTAGRSLSWVLTVAVVALHGAYLVGDRTWWGEWIAIWPPVGWLALLGPTLVLARAWRTLGLLVLLTVVHTEWPRSAGSGDAAGGDLRIVVWNVAGTAASWREMKSFRPDLALVQESAGPPPIGWEGYEWFEGLDPGILTRFPARRLPSESVGPWTEPLMLLVAVPPDRRLLVVDVRLVLPSIVTWVAGGFEGSPRNGFEARVGQFERLARLIHRAQRESGADAVVLAGDFNTPARMPSLEPLRSFLVDAWRLSGRGWGGTATADLPVARIDQCWVSPALAVRSAFVRRMSVSDHRMLVVDLALKPRG